MAKYFYLKLQKLTVLSVKHAHFLMFIAEKSQRPSEMCSLDIKLLKSQAGREYS